MATIKFKGTPVKISGDLPAKGSKAPGFTLVRTDLSEASLSDFKGKRLLLNIFPSVGTSVCSAAMRKFNQMAVGIRNTTVLAISKDLPFAHASFCSIEGIENVIPLSGFRDTAFGRDYGVDTLEGPFKGLYARSVVIINEGGEVTYTQLVPETAEEPDYESVLKALE
jgi:thioredoxin-dependent peroxiredoxin